MQPITKIAQKLNLSLEDVALYGDYKAKILPSVWEKIKERPNGRLILVTAMTPTPSGEGKTVTVIAEDLSLIVKTISPYRARLLVKLQFHTTTISCAMPSNTILTTF